MLSQFLISGIQQIGLGNKSVYDTWDWYRKNLGMDLPIFDEAAEAALMLPYTGGEPRSRHAVLAMNHMGGGGLEIWQYTSKTPIDIGFEPTLGDTGITINKFKSPDVNKAYQELKKRKVEILTNPSKRATGENHFYIKDLYGNLIEIIESDNWFRKKLWYTGGIYGCTIGVSNMNLSLPFYQDLLGYDKVLHDSTKVHEDFSQITNKEHKIRRVILTHSKERRGPFSRLLGRSEIELIQNLDHNSTPLFKDRMWGDLGYIHLCFDIRGMDALRKRCKEFGSAFTVDSGDFDMGEAAGQFAYIEDPDGTLIEFVEAHKIPLLKKINWYLDLQKRPQDKSLPTWMLYAMGLSRVKK
jgi:catechol 2,3-dioxygenase-like lactoylglutathione lyase family enzyme